MLDKKSKQVLKALNKYLDKTNNDYNYVNGSRLLIPYLPKNFNHSQIDETLWYLESQGYIDCQNAEGTILSIYVKYNAKNYTEFSRIKIKDFIYKSVLVPILVSILTSGIIYLLTTYCFK